MKSLPGFRFFSSLIRFTSGASKLAFLSRPVKDSYVKLKSKQIFPIGFINIGQVSADHAIGFNMADFLNRIILDAQADET